MSRRDQYPRIAIAAPKANRPPPRTRLKRPVRQHSESTLELLDALANQGQSATVGLDEIVERVGERVFGVMLLIATLPAFIPLPFGVGAIAGPLVVLVGVQLAAMRECPWLPRWLARRQIRRSSLQHFLARIAPLLRWLERTLRPRRGELLDVRAVRIMTGLLLVVLGVLLSLPLPLTNYPFGLLLVLYSVALIEHDGRLLMIAWAIGGATILGFALLSEVVAQWLVS